MSQTCIFISHASSEKDQAQRIADSLENLGVSTWLALRDVKAGQNFAQSIIDAIEGSSHLLVLVTENSIHSQHVMREVTIAVDQKKTLLPLFYGLPTDNQKALPSEWRYQLAVAQAIAWQDDQDPGQVIMPHLANEPITPREEATVTSAVVIDVTDQNFQRLVLERSAQIPVVIAFWAEWCDPCKQLSPVLEKLTAEQGGRVILAKIDVDANQQLAASFQVQLIPSVFSVIGGQVAPLFQGAMPEAQIRQVFTKMLG